MNGKFLAILMAVVLLIGLTINGNAAGKPSYVYIDAPPPLNKTGVITASVGEVRASDVVEVPYILWGGDLAAGYANGNSFATNTNSVFGKAGLKLKFYRQDKFKKQVEDYLSGKTPYLRCTMGQLIQVLDVLNRDERTKPVAILQYTWSTGGDVLDVKEGINSVKDLADKKKITVTQAYGPHYEFLTKLLADAGKTVKDINLKFVEEISGDVNSPLVAFCLDKEVGAAFMISPDAAATHSSAAEGSEYSMPGSKNLISTLSARHVIADLYFVRSDYFKKNRGEVEKFVRGLLEAQEQIAVMFKNNNSKEYKEFIKFGSTMMFDTPTMTADVEGLYADCSFVGWEGNVEFFNNPDNLRNMKNLTDEIQTSFIAAGWLSKKNAVKSAEWDYNALKAGLSSTNVVEETKFDASQVAQAISQKSGESGRLSFEIYFDQNQEDFPLKKYGDQFKEAVKWTQTYSGAVITVDGYCDPKSYCDLKEKKTPGVTLRQIKQKAKDLSLKRSEKIIDAIISLAKSMKINDLDKDQFFADGHGFKHPNSIEEDDDNAEPVKPQNEAERAARRVVRFNLMPIE